MSRSAVVHVEATAIVRIERYLEVEDPEKLESL